MRRKRSLSVPLVLAAHLVIGASCNAFEGLSYTPKDATTSDDGGSKDDANTPGPVMVQAGSFRVDSTEVTNAQYDVFLREAGTEGTTHPRCAWKTSFRPSHWPYASGEENWPVADVDWCDAFAYCEWAGKRLCGRMGGGSLASDRSDRALGQWEHACSAGTQAFPYAGPTANPTACNDRGGSIAKVASFPGCEGAFPGLFDMVGNVKEWEDGCAASAVNAADDTCFARGGDADDLGQCASRDELPRSTTNRSVGFRCCSRD